LRRCLRGPKFKQSPLTDNSMGGSEEVKSCFCSPEMTHSVIAWFNTERYSYVPFSSE